MTDKRRFIDVMTVMSCLAVVFLHANGICHANPASTGSLLWRVSFWHHLFIFGAPVFFMISGATLMEYRTRYDTRTFFIKRIRRSVIPFVFWSLIAFAVHVIVAGSTSVKEIVLLPLTICACDYMSIYWFFMAIFAAYLFLPALSLLAGRRNVLLYLIAVWFALESVYPYVSRLAGLSVCGKIAFPYVGGGVIYMLLGYVLFKFDLSKRAVGALYVLGVLAFVIRWTGTVLGMPRISGGYWDPWCVVYSSAVFIFVKGMNFDRMPQWIVRAVDWIKPHTLGIYLIHGFVTDIAASKLHWPVDSFLYRVVGPFVLIAVCVMISKAFKKTPVLERFV